jgi:hypothetical protein
LAALITYEGDISIIPERFNNISTAEKTKAYDKVLSAQKKEEEY